MLRGEEQRKESLGLGALSREGKLEGEGVKDYFVLAGLGDRASHAPRQKTH